MKSKAQFRKGCIRTLVLKILSERPMYGYEIAQKLAERSENIFSLGQGTLYPLLYSLEKKALICTSHTEQDETTGRKRLYYELTEKGQTSFQEDLATWSDIVKGMSMILGDSYA